MARALRIWLSGAIMALAAFAFALSVGSVPTDVAQVVAALLGHASVAGDVADIVFGLRLPRALAAFAVGALLALAGVLMQTLMRNALADPYLLGVSGGAAVGALMAILAGAAAVVVHVGAGVGALLAASFVLSLGRGGLDDEFAPGAGQRLLLSGVALASVTGAVVALILSVAPEAQLRGMLFWLIGDLAGAGDWRLPWLALLAALLAITPQARALNVLARGELIAASLGVNVRRLRLTALTVAALGTAAAVATAGTIGFVGLIAPHMVRLAIGNDQRILLPAAALFGGALLLLADTLARTVAAPMQLPTGALMALIGAPILLALLWKREHGH